MIPTICWVIPTIPKRKSILRRAVASVDEQRGVRAWHMVQPDSNRKGASATRNSGLRRALKHSDPEWIGFLDDDDELLHDCSALLISAAELHEVDVAWGWYEVIGGEDPLPGEFRGRTYDPGAPHCVPITYIARASLMRAMLDEIGGFDETIANSGFWSQDERVLSWLVRHGGHVAIPDTVWLWHHDTPGGNTSGRPDKAFRR